MLTLWHSPQQRARLGRIFRYRALTGDTVECTNVSSTPDHGTAWPDMTKVGEAADYGAFLGYVWEDAEKEQTHNLMRMGMR
jgi:hypothetical protein